MVTAVCDHWRIATSAGYDYGGRATPLGRHGRKILLRLDDEGAAAYGDSIVDWSNELCPMTVNEISEFNSNKFTVKVNKRGTGIKMKLRTRAIEATATGAKKAKHVLAGKGTAL